MQLGKLAIRSYSFLGGFESFSISSFTGKVLAVAVQRACKVASVHVRRQAKKFAMKDYGFLDGFESVFLSASSGKFD